MNILEDKNLFNNLIKEVSNQYGVSPYYVEKDYYAISVLREITKRSDLIVFKGGTSLSVCHKIINRFSEDIDISYSKERITESERRKIKTYFMDSIESIGLTISNKSDIRSRRIFNRYLCEYSSLINGQSDRVIVEWATQTPSFPVERKLSNTLIGRYLESIGRFDLVRKYNLESFYVLTQTIERTFVDKLFAICDYYLANKPYRQSRHLYDIYMLLGKIDLNSALIELFIEVRNYRKELDVCLSAKDGIKISNLIEEIIISNYYYNDYINNTIPLLYERIEYSNCIKALNKVKFFLKECNL